MKKWMIKGCIGACAGVMVLMLGNIFIHGNDMKEKSEVVVPVMSAEKQRKENNVEIPRDFVMELLLYQYMEYGLRMYSEDNHKNERYSVDIEKNMLPYDTEFGMKDADKEPYKTDLAKEIIPELANNVYNFELEGQDGCIYMSIDTYNMKIYVYDMVKK